MTTIALIPKMIFKKIFDGMGFSGSPPNPTLSPKSFLRISGDISPALRSRGAFTTASGSRSGSGVFGSSASRADIVSSALERVSSFAPDDRATSDARARGFARAPRTASSSREARAPPVAPSRSPSSSSSSSSSPRTSSSSSSSSSRA
eukprot:CAMPEP_0179722678 /NCGR_PEP_ID=MMETSP0938-20121108/5118_1 /TAXON_ID=548131 ORGANISM="Ostreococcus mediterraneus, Strain clade-D-RCC1107" /NCGR_SAMPLE_ID=MMETSP0938 /ASSEMBLY_ACC=CAM_ASM_000576 /LENGTH=147 /DNA_ID=CAMNT_0021596659 /DNA_START=116 /DNA_END=557 /DNA_ORIENTATION=-